MLENLERSDPQAWQSATTVDIKVCFAQRKKQRNKTKGGGAFRYRITVCYVRYFMSCNAVSYHLVLCHVSRVTAAKALLAEFACPRFVLDHG